MKRSPTEQKLRGGYYTLTPIAAFLCRWAIADSTANVLEPSSGDGMFLEAAARQLFATGASRAAVSEQLHGVEIEASEAEKSRDKLRRLGVSKPSIRRDDFFAFCKAALAGQRFDAVVGNPPFIRYQNFTEEQRSFALHLMAQAGLRPNRLTNAWMPFIVGSTLLLNTGGRLAMVVPAELLQVNYAAELRRFMSFHFVRLTIFTFKRLVFPGIQQEVVLICGEKGGNGAGEALIRTVELQDLGELGTHRHTEFEAQELKSMDHSKEKWTQYFLSARELDLLRTIRKHPKLTELGQVAAVDVGVVTGMNDFFVLSQDSVRELRVEEQTERLVARSGQLRGAFFAAKEWAEAARKGTPVFLLNLPPPLLRKRTSAVDRYISWGERQGFHRGYKCSIREPWYSVPSVWIPDAFLLRQIHLFPKVVVNRARATSTDTVHRVRFKKGVVGGVVAAGFLNSLTFAFSEVIGRSYGGGVLELEPNEAERLMIPLELAEKLDLNEADAWLRTGKPIEALLDSHDAILLEGGLGLSADDVYLLRGVWLKLRNRRIERRAARPVE
jgi:adenine-specific DNA-methyltransferase